MVWQAVAHTKPSALLQKRHELIHSEQELADVVVQRRLPQRVTGMGFAERDCGRLACGIEEHPRRMCESWITVLRLAPVERKLRRTELT